MNILTLSSNNRKKFHGMKEAGQRLAEVFANLEKMELIGKSTFFIDQQIKDLLEKNKLISQALGYKGFPCVSCISVNSVLVHGIPNEKTIILPEDIVKIDICVSYNDFCADMARIYTTEKSLFKKYIGVAHSALSAGINACLPINYIGDIGYAIENVLTSSNVKIVDAFCGHAIGKKMHEDPQVPNRGKPRQGQRLYAGLALAIEPMFTISSEEIEIARDGWTAVSADGSMAFHVEDTVFITDNGPVVLTVN